MNNKNEKIVESIPTMELFLKYHEQKLLCSIDSTFPAPQGANKFFDHHGYMILHNICSSNDLKKIDFENNQVILEIQSKIKLILEDILEKKLMNKNFIQKTYSVDEKHSIYLDNDKDIISLVLQVDTNSLIPWPFFIKDLNKNKCFISLKNGHGILYNGSEVTCWRNNLETRYNKLGIILNKFLRKRDDTYHTEIIFNYYVEK